MDQPSSVIQKGTFTPCAWNFARIVSIRWKAHWPLASFQLPD